MQELKSYIEKLPNSQKYEIALNKGKDNFEHLQIFLKKKNGKTRKYPFLTFSFETIGKREYYDGDLNPTIEKYEKQKP